MPRSRTISQRPRFNLGQVVATPGVLGAVDSADVMRALVRHASGDWGIVSSADARANDDALIKGARILSAYETAAGTKFWVITEWDRSLTSVLLPSEY